MKRVLVLAGGDSNEREISLKSAENVVEALQRAGYDVVQADPAATDFNLSALVKDIDAVLPILHGQGGEDGVLQQQLEALKVPYFGSDSQSMAVSFDKVLTKKVLDANGVLTARYEVVNRQQFEASDLRRRPYVLKPIKGGSSIDTFVVRHPETQGPEQSRLDDVFARYENLLLEELIEGKEITVGVLDTTALPVILIVPPEGEEFNYENKYNGSTQEITESTNLDHEVEKHAQGIALKVHELVGARHISRTDMIISDDGTIYTLEINSLPGMTRESLVPKATAAIGIDIVTLVTQFVEMALRDYNREKEL